MKNDKELWATIKGFEGLYEVSNMGNVRSLKYGKIKILKLAKNKFGYYYVILSKNGKTKHFTVHRLVANAFIENPNNYPQINHKDENKTNNKVENLEWCNNQYNKRYSNSKQVMGISENGRKTILLDATRDGDLLGFSYSNISKAANGKFNKIGNHRYKGIEWYYIPKGLYNFLVSIPNLTNDYQTVIIPKNDIVEYR